MWLGRDVDVITAWFLCRLVSTTVVRKTNLMVVSTTRRMFDGSFVVCIHTHSPILDNPYLYISPRTMFFRIFFEDYYGFQKSNIILLSDDGTTSRQLPTRRNIIDAMKWLVRDAKPNDSLVFHCAYFSICGFFFCFSGVTRYLVCFCVRFGSRWTSGGRGWWRRRWVWWKYVPFNSLLCVAG